MFKYLFAAKGSEANLLRLLNDILGPKRGIVSLEYLDRENDPRRHGGRSSYVDVLARSEDGRLCHVEVQLDKEVHFFERLVYYASISFFNQLSTSEGYEKLRPVIFVSLMDFCLFPGRPADWHSEHRILDVKDHRNYCDSLEFHFLELPKLRGLMADGRIEDTGLSRVLMYLGRMGGYPNMKSLVERDAGIERLEEGVRSFFRERGNLALYKLREREETDYRNALKYAEARGRSEGEARGETSLDRKSVV